MILLVSFFFFFYRLFFFPCSIPIPFLFDTQYCYFIHTMKLKNLSHAMLEADELYVVT